MSERKVKATRMELLGLKKRIKIAERGHKLLKDKRDELMKEFMALVRTVKGLRKEVEEALAKAYVEMGIVQAQMGIEMTHAALTVPRSVEIDVTSVNRSGVVVPRFESVEFKGPKVGGYSLLTTTPALDNAVASFRTATERVVELAEKERAIELMAAEIEKTRRRVNALEHVLIPELKSNARYVQMKLDELERANFANLMRIKSMLK